MRVCTESCIQLRFINVNISQLAEKKKGSCPFSNSVIIKMLQTGVLQTWCPWPPNKNAPHGCEAFGAENETRTIPYNALITNDLEEAKKTSGETWVKLLWLFRTYRESDLYGHLTPIKTSSTDLLIKQYLRHLPRVIPQKNVSLQS